jgi:hypothetical protein
VVLKGNAPNDDEIAALKDGPPPGLSAPAGMWAL